MRVEAMKHFLAVSDYQSISKAARISSIPQQSLSSMMGALEKELGVTLFERVNKKVVLTEEGQIFYAYCNQFFKEYHLLQHKLSPIDRKIKRNQLKIATQNNIAQTIIPTWLSALLKIAPDIKVDIRIQSAVDIVKEVVAEKVDVGFILLFKKDDHIWPELPEEVIFHKLFESRPYIWLNKENPLSNNKSIQMRMLSSGPVIQDQSSDLALFHFIFEEYFRLDLQILQAVNPKIMRNLVKENIATCPDLKMQNGELALAAVFDDETNIVALPLSAKDDYRLITGYVVRHEIDTDEEMQMLFDLLI